MTFYFMLCQWVDVGGVMNETTHDISQKCYVRGRMYNHFWYLHETLEY